MVRSQIRYGDSRGGCPGPQVFSQALAAVRAAARRGLRAGQGGQPPAAYGPVLRAGAAVHVQSVPPFAAGFAAGRRTEERAAQARLRPRVAGVALRSDRRVRSRALREIIGELAAEVGPTQRERGACGSAPDGRRRQRGADALDDCRGGVLNERTWREQIGLAAPHPLRRRSGRPDADRRHPARTAARPTKRTCCARSWRPIIAT